MNPVWDIIFTTGAIVREGKLEEKEDFCLRENEINTVEFENDKRKWLEWNKLLYFTQNQLIKIIKRSKLPNRNCLN